MKRILFGLLLFSIALATSCKKTTEQVDDESKIIGKWILKREVYTRIGSATPGSSSNYAANEYIDLQSGGKATVRVDDKITTTVWELLDNGKILFIHPAGSLDLSDDGYEIKTLTANSLVLSKKELTPAPGYELLIYLEK
jgi:hypothetical protein